jgi:hypothetical protein
VPGSPGHLAHRFLDVLLSRPLTPDERSRVESWLSPMTALVFFSQAPSDQRHGYHAATVVIGAGVEDRTVIRAALLHDVGKRHAGLGVLGRTIVSLLILLRLPLPRRARYYRDHGELGSAELATLGCEPLVVLFARHHHQSRPPDVEAETWDLLQTADQPPKTGTTVRSRIS